MPNLTTGGLGIQRHRAKGAARPDQLWDALNCIVRDDGTVGPRAGSRVHAELPSGTAGLMTYRENLYVFSGDPDVVDGATNGVRVALLTRPDFEGSASLQEIHFAEPFLGYPYVVAEWSDGAIFHYWLEGEGETGGGWAPNTIYRLGQIVRPEVPNGYAYSAQRLGEPGPAWAPSTEYAVGDVVEPTEPNGFDYIVVEAYGSPPRSGATEPEWIAEPDAAVIEEADVALASGGTSNSGSAGTTPPDVKDRYGSGKYASTNGSDI